MRSHLVIRGCLPDLTSIDGNLTFDEFCVLADAALNGDVHTVPLPNRAGGAPWTVKATTRAALVSSLSSADAAARLRDALSATGAEVA